MGEVGFGVALALLAGLIMAVNALVAVALVRLIWKNRGLGLCFVLNLAIADSLVGFTITGLVAEELSGPEHQTPKNHCIFRMACVTSPSAASVLTVILVAFDRYLAIEHPFRYFRIMRAPLVGACIGGLWLLAGLIGFLPVIIRPFQKPTYHEECTFYGVFRPTYVLTVFCVAFCPACGLFLYFHWQLLQTANLHAQQIRELGHSRSAGIFPALHPHSDAKAMRTVAVLVGCFTLSWSPFFVGSIVELACEHCDLEGLLERYLWVLGLCSSLANPLVYACWQKDVRLQVCQMCRSLKSRVSPLCHSHRQPGVPAVSLARPEE
ncbi:glucose-dependent insulinotropic receptor [Hemicordylus capensis]|uniref:glucose-dependent insulinotropic receptor n=1 Tax=Hemicordylus capensis TaxID=884348 RepID=UPI00230267ED|nr:glucose-dependent insulinotropic receptor [Hemicordylus capensis]